jgi:hypothetical protein
MGARGIDTWCAALPLVFFLTDDFELNFCLWALFFW